MRDEWRARLLRLSFEQHLAPQVVRRIAADPGALRLRGEMREITALFTDIESFTSMTERAEPTELVAPARRRILRSPHVSSPTMAG